MAYTTELDPLTSSRESGSGLRLGSVGRLPYRREVLLRTGRKQRPEASEMHSEVYGGYEIVLSRAWRS